jgi:excisionase family DNA binding protein
VIVRLAEVSYAYAMLGEEEMGKDMVNYDHLSDMLTVREVARLLHVHPNTLRRWSNDGRIRAYRINRRGDRRFKREEVDRFLAESDGQPNIWEEIMGRR